MSTWNLPPGVSTNNEHINPSDHDKERGELITRKVFGRKACFCNKGCQDSFREDRKHGLIYPSYEVEGKLLSVEAASIQCGFCAYCGE